MTIIFEVDMENMTAFPYGSTKATVESALTAANMFPNMNYETPDSTFANVSKVGTGPGSYFELRSSVDASGHVHWASTFTEVDTAFLRMAVMFRSDGTSALAADNGYDFGSSQGTRNTNTTGGKMPGLTWGEPGWNTGGTLTNNAWSGRQMWRGLNTAGSGGSDRTHVAPEFYYYGQDLGVQRRYPYRGSHTPADAVQFTSDGTGPGTYGDPAIGPKLNENIDTWVHFLIEYHVPDSTAGYMKCWTLIEGTDTTWQPQLNLTGTRPRPAGFSGVNNLLFQQFFGGQGSDWHPDFVGYTRWKDVGVYTTESEAMDAFGTAGDPTAFAITTPANLATDVATPIVPAGTAPNDGNNDVIQVSVIDDTNTVTVSPFGEFAVTYTPGTESWTTNTAITIPQGEEDLRVRSRRWGVS